MNDSHDPLHNFRHAIPVIAHQAESSGQLEQHGGSAFLGSAAGIDYLLTAAHLPAGAPLSVDWTTWDRWVTVLTSGGPVSIELFHKGSSGSLIPIFGYRRLDTNPGRVHDIIWLTLTGALAPLLQNLAGDHTCFSLSPTDCAPIVTAYGYPVSADPWPQLRTSTGVLQRMNGLVFEATMRVEPGFSGGPVVDRDNNLAGMAIGSNDSDEAQIVPVQVIELLVGT